MAAIDPSASAGDDDATAPPVGWITACALLSTAVYPVLGLYGFGVALPVIARAFAGQPHAVLLCQLIGSVVGFAFAIASPIIGPLVDRFGSRPVLMASSAAFALVGASGGLLENLYLILATRVLLGFTVAGTLVAGLAGIGALSPRQRIRLFGWQAVVGGMLAILAYLLVGMAAAAGWRWPFALHLIGFALLPLFWALPKRAAPPAGHVATSAPRVPLPISLLLVAMFMGMTSVVGPLFAPFFLADIGIADPSLQALPLMVMGATAIVASSAYAPINRALGLDGTFALAAVATGLGLLLAGRSDTLVLISVALGVAAVGAALYSPNLNAAVVHFAGAGRGRALGIASAAMYGAQAVFPFIAQFIAGRAGPAAVFNMFGVAAVALGIAFALAALRGRKTHALV